MTNNDIRGRDSADLRGFNELFTFQTQGLTAYDTRHIQPRHHPDRHKDEQDVLAKEGNQQDHEEHKREGVEDFQ